MDNRIVCAPAQHPQFEWTRVGRLRRQIYCGSTGLRQRQDRGGTNLALAKGHS